MKKGNKKHGIFLINAPYGGEYLRFRGEPTSILYASCVLFKEIKEGRFFELTPEHIRLYNPGYSDEDFFEKIIKDVCDLRPRLIGICNTTSGNEEARKIAKLIKTINPDAVTVFGGPHEDGMPPRVPMISNYLRKTDNGQILKTSAYCTDVDFSIFGDGEYLFEFLAKEIFKNNGNVSGLKRSLLSESTSVAQIEGHGGICFKHPDTHLLVILRSSQKKLNLSNLPLLPRISLT